MKKNLNYDWLNKSFSSFHKLFLVLKIAAMILIFGLLNVSATSASSPNADEPQKITVSGKVTDSQTGEPLPGCEHCCKRCHPGY